jgi:hypothetical protein
MVWPQLFDSGEPMKHHVSKSSEADFVSRDHLIRLLVQQIERTFATDGRDQALHEVADMLRGLDEAALRAMVYRQGLQTEDELAEPEADSAKGSNSEGGIGVT